MSYPLDAVFLELINAHLGIAHKVCRVYAKEEDDRQDLFQEMMYQLWRSFASFDQRSKFSTWMYKVCLNTALTYKKKFSSNKVIILQGAHDQIPNQPSTNDEEAVADLYAAIATLAPVNKALIMLYLEEMSYEEIAQITGLSKSNVSVKLVRIKKALEKTIKKSSGT